MNSYEIHLIPTQSATHVYSATADIDADELHYDREFIKFYNKTKDGEAGYPKIDNMVALFPVASVRYIIKKGNNKNAESEITRTRSTKAVA